MKELIIICSFLNLSLYAAEVGRAICGWKDDRILSNIKKDGRIVKNYKENGGCSGSLVSKNCMVSAGHCVPYMKFVEFNVPQSSWKGVNHPGPEDQYEVDQSWIRSQSISYGQDWAVFKIRKNVKTGMFPGEKYGNYDVSFELPKEGDVLRITGFGASRKRERKYSQQTLTGPFGKIKKMGIFHRVDTKPGNSGSGIIDETTGKLIAVHTDGFCSFQDDTYNIGTSVELNKEFKQAVLDCLEDK